MRRGKLPSAVAVEVSRLESRTLLAAAYPELVDPTPVAGDFFGWSGATVLTNGNVVVVDAGDDTGADNAGAVSLYNGATGSLISILRGSSEPGFSLV